MATIGIFIAGLIGGYAIKFVIDIRMNKSSGSSKATATDGSVSQSGNTAGGHIAGGNIKTGSE